MEEKDVYNEFHATKSSLFWASHILGQLFLPSWSRQLWAVQILETNR